MRSLLPRGSNPASSACRGWELFEHQDQAYRDSVLPPSVHARVSVEAAGTFGWHKYVGSHGATVGMTSFGASAPLAEPSKKFGFSTEHVIEQAKGQIARVKAGK